MPNRLAPISLILATILFVATLPVSATYWGGLVNAFAEAAMIGGLADWFAVVALFRRPFGLPIPHTAILLKYRARITQGISDTVQNSWLSKDALLTRLAGWDLAGMLLRAAQDPVHRAALIAALRSTLREAVRSMQPETAAHAAMDLAKGAADRDRLVSLVTGAGTQAIEAGWHMEALSFAAGGAADWLGEERVSAMLAANLRATMEDYSASPLRRLGKWMAEKSNVLNYDDLARSILASVRDDLAAIPREESHPARVSFDEWVRRFVGDLPQNNEAADFIEKSATTAIHSAAAGQGLTAVFERLRGWLLDDLARDDSRILQHAVAWADAGLSRLASDEAALRALDTWLKERLARAVEENHHEIGAIVRHNLDTLNDEQLITQIESRVGPDLQYIRLNGAIVGGLVGAALYLVKDVLVG
ncbi:MAG: DUF445 domain-containing protein [Ignavibacteriae bacterium]|nr:DUF445 domain-containing protein [Ignavibacteriota bacterium]